MSLKFDLQLFAQEKPKKQRPRKGQDARKKGQVAKEHGIARRFHLAVYLLFICSCLAITSGSRIHQLFTRQPV